MAATAPRRVKVRAQIPGRRHRGEADAESRLADRDREGQLRHAPILIFTASNCREGVKEIVWSGGKLPDEHYDEFVFAGFLASDLKPGPLYIPVTQECEKGRSELGRYSGAGSGCACAESAGARARSFSRSMPGTARAVAAPKIFKAGALDHRGAVGARDAGRRARSPAAS